MRCGAKTLDTTALFLVYSTTEYCAPFSCCSAHTHLINRVMNGVLRIVSECLCPTRTDHLPILSGNQPVQLRRLGEKLFLNTGRTLAPNRNLNSSIGFLKMSESLSKRLINQQVALLYHYQQCCYYFNLILNLSALLLRYYFYYH